jgi:hypothetical protein
MINLIPNEEKKLMAKNFFYRLATVFFMALGFCMLIASVTLLPSYFLSSTKEDLITKKLEAEKAEPIDLLDQQTLKTLSDIDNKLLTIEKSEKNKFVVSERIVNQIVSKRISDVKINQIVYENSDTGEKIINIYGTASSRSRLLVFREILEENPLFKQVNLPISNFIKGSNIQFSLSLIPS